MESPEKLRVNVSSRPLRLGGSSGTAENENLSSTFCDFGRYFSGCSVCSCIDRIIACDCTAGAVCSIHGFREESAFFCARLLNSTAQSQNQAMQLTDPRHLVGRLVLPLISRRSCSVAASLGTWRGKGPKLRRVLSRLLMGPFPFCLSSATCCTPFSRIPTLTGMLRCLGGSVVTKTKPCQIPITRN